MAHDADRPLFVRGRSCVFVVIRYSKRTKLEHNADAMRKLDRWDQRYNEESILMDGLYEFHPEAFASLSNDELQVLRTYYLIGSPPPEDVFLYRRHLLRENPDLERRARRVLRQVTRSLSVVPPR